MVHDELIADHIQALAEIDARSRSNSHRLDDLKKIIDIVYDMNKNIALIAEQSKNQGEQLKELVNTLKKHEEKIDEISDKMETKESVKRLSGRIEDLEKKDGDKAEKLLGQVKWLLISLMFTAGFYLIWNFLLK
jgi:uncharacterized protein YhaN